MLFWLSLGVCVYIYFGYPALLWILSRVRARPVLEGDTTPKVTFVIAAYNEERNIGAKIENTLSLDYPAELMEVLVVSNGSSDATERIVSSCSDPRVKLVALPEPGKIPALNEGVARASGEIVVFTDADFLLDSDALRQLMGKFHDPAVGGVCGSRRSNMTREGDATGEGEGLYGRWDKWQKILESRIGSVFAADGLLYAIRRTLYVPVADPAQADDIAISTRIPLQGYRLLFDECATAWEHATVEAAGEFRRKIRVTSHSVRALLLLRGALVTSGFYSVELLSHKLVRHFVPFFLLALLASSAWLARLHWIYMAAFAAQLALYTLALLGALLRNRPVGRTRLFYVPYFFTFVNAAAFAGILSMLRGRRTTAWRDRSSDDLPGARKAA
jgi:cellulose synthase/poly-beta-1,6-N-acetylglucosamine synthase-like glycosyltransferase